MNMVALSHLSKDEYLLSLLWDIFSLRPNFLTSSDTFIELLTPLYSSFVLIAFGHAFSRYKKYIGQDPDAGSRDELAALARLQQELNINRQTVMQLNIFFRTCYLKLLCN